MWMVGEPSPLDMAEGSSSDDSTGGTGESTFGFAMCRDSHDSKLCRLTTTPS